MALRPAPAPSGDLIDLGEELELGALEETAPEETVDLGGDLLAELGEEPVAVAAPPARASGPRPGAARAAARPQPVVEEEPIDLDEPILLEDDPEPAPAAGRGVPLDIGRLTPGQERTIEIPLQATVDGRPVTLRLRVSVRLSR
jgi:hypothetical protein